MSEDVIKIFYSYSRKDLGLRNTLEAHLATLKRANRIQTWHDLELEPGTEWERDIQAQLNTADIILLLVSSDFMASDYCYSTELERAIVRHDAGEARVIPVILRPCDWNHSYVPFSKLNVLPTHAKPVTSWTDTEEAFTVVAQQIRETVDQLRAERLIKYQAEEQQKRQQLAPKETEQQTDWKCSQKGKKLNNSSSQTVSSASVFTEYQQEVQQLRISPKASSPSVEKSNRLSIYRQPGKKTGLFHRVTVFFCIIAGLLCLALGCAFIWQGEPRLVSIIFGVVLCFLGIGTVIYASFLVRLSGFFIELAFGCCKLIAVKIRHRVRGFLEFIRENV